MGITGSGQYYGGDGGGSFVDYLHRFVYETDQFNPIALLWDGIKGKVDGTDRFGNTMSGFDSSMKIVSAVPFMKVGGVVTKGLNPAKLARGWQGKGTYLGVDNWRNITLSEGKYVVGGLPGQSNYYTTLSGLNRSGLSKNSLFQGLQVSKHPQFGYRGQVGIYRVGRNTPAAFGTTYANPQFGAGGLPQIFIPDYSGLQLIEMIKLK